MAGSAVVLAGAFAALCAALALTAPAAAHAAYASSAPAFAAVLDSAPEQIELRFTQQLFRREGANAMRLERSDDGAAIALGEIVIDNADRARMRAALLGPLAPGRYLVAWQISRPTTATRIRAAIRSTSVARQPLRKRPPTARWPPLC